MSNVLFKQVKLPNGRNKYVPYGIEVNDLPTGIYFVDIREHCKEEVSCSYLGQLYKVGEPKEIDLTEICGIHHLVATVMETEKFRELMRKDCSATEIVATTISIINNLNKKKK